MKFVTTLTILALSVSKAQADDTQEEWVICNPSGNEYRNIDVTIEDYNSRQLFTLFESVDGNIQEINLVEGQNFFPTCSNNEDDNQCTQQFKYFVVCDGVDSVSCDNCLGMFGGEQSCYGTQSYLSLLPVNISDFDENCFCDVKERVRGKRINHSLGFSEDCDLPLGSTGDIISIELRDIDKEFIKEDCKFIQDEFDMHLCGLSFDPDTYIDDNIDAIIDFTKRTFSIYDLDLNAIGYKFDQGKVQFGQRKRNSTISFPKPILFTLSLGDTILNTIRIESTNFEIQIPQSEMLKRLTFNWALRTDSINWFRELPLKNGTFLWNAGTLLPKIQIFTRTEKEKLKQCEGIVGDGIILCNDANEVIDYTSFNDTITYVFIGLLVYILILSGLCAGKQMKKGVSIKLLISSFLVLGTNAAFCVDSNALNKVQSIKSTFPTTLNGISTFVHNHDFLLSGKDSSLCIHVMDEKGEAVLFSVEFIVSNIRKEYALENIYSTFTIDRIEKPSEFDSAMCIGKEFPYIWNSEGFVAGERVCRTISHRCSKSDNSGCRKSEGEFCAEEGDVFLGDGSCCLNNPPIHVIDPVAKECFLDPESKNNDEECDLKPGENPKFCKRDGTNFFIRDVSKGDVISKVFSSAPYTTLLETNNLCNETPQKASFEYTRIMDQAIDLAPRKEYQTKFNKMDTLCNPQKLDNEFNINGGYQVVFERYCKPESVKSLCSFETEQSQALYTMLKFKPKNFYRVYKIDSAESVDAVATITMNFVYANGTKFSTSREQQLSKITGAIPFFEHGDLKVQIEDIGQILGAEPRTTHLVQGTEKQRPDKLFEIEDRGVYFVNALDPNQKSTNKAGVIQCTKVDSSGIGRERCRLLNKGACTPRSGPGNAECGAIFENGRDIMLGPQVFKNEKDSSGKPISKPTLREISDPDGGNKIIVNGTEIPQIKFNNKVTTIRGTNILNKLQIFSPVGGAVKFKLETKTTVGVFKADVTPECELADKLGPSGFFGSDIGFSFNVTIRSKDNPGQVSVQVLPVDDSDDFDDGMTIFPTRLIIGTEPAKVMLVGNTGIANNKFKVVFKSHNAQCEVSTSFIASPIDLIDTLPPAPGLTLIPTASPTVRTTEEIFQDSTPGEDDDGSNSVLIGVSVGLGLIFGLPLILSVVSNMLSDDEE